MPFISRQNKRKQRFLLFMSIFMIAVTTALIFLGFYVMPVTKFNLLLISIITVMGYVIGLLYYDNYLTIKKKKDAGNY